jgi:hypothetical protein
MGSDPKHQVRSNSNKASSEVPAIEPLGCIKDDREDGMILPTVLPSQIVEHGHE